MPNFKVDLEGLDIFLADLKPEKISKQLNKGIAIATSTLQRDIASAVVQTYNVTSKEVNQLVVGKSISNQKRGKNIIKGGLEYRYKAKPLHTFSPKESPVSVNSRFLLPRGNGSFARLKRKTTNAVSVEVRRGKRKTVVGKYGFGGFYQKRASGSKWAAIQGGESKARPAGIYERKQNATWITEPIDRAPIRRAFGLSVTQMVETVLDNNTKLKKTVNNFDLLIAEHIQL